MPAPPTPVATELLAAHGFFDFVTSGPEAARRSVGARASVIAGAVAVSVPGDPSGSWTRVLGLGATEPVTARVLEEVRDFYAVDHDALGGGTVPLVLAAPLLPPDWAALCEAFGIEEQPGGHKLARDLARPIPSVPARTTARGLRIGPVTPGWAGALGTLMTDIFEMRSPALAAMVAGVLEREGWWGIGAWDGDDLVAGSLLHVEGDLAHLVGTTTLPRARGRGAQTALTSARLAAAAEAGCRWATVEIEGDPDGQGNSYRAMRTAGFTTIFAYPSCTMAVGPSRRSGSARP